MQRNLAHFLEALRKHFQGGSSLVSPDIDRHIPGFLVDDLVQLGPDDPPEEFFDGLERVCKCVIGMGSVKEEIEASEAKREVKDRRQGETPPVPERRRPVVVDSRPERGGEGRRKSIEGGARVRSYDAKTLRLGLTDRGRRDRRPHRQPVGE
jgi:hypothetical protein